MESSIANSQERSLLIDSFAEAVSGPLNTVKVMTLSLVPHQDRSKADLLGLRLSWAAKWLEIIQEKLSYKETFVKVCPDQT